MKQYCRYCVSCIDADCFYCTDHETVLSEAKIKSVNNCPDFIESQMGDVITGKMYKPKGKPIQGQIKFEFGVIKMGQCEKCKNAIWDYCDYFGNKRQYFVYGCTSILNLSNKERKDFVANKTINCSYYEERRYEA